jgi:hypothetical protein
MLETRLDPRARSLERQRRHEGEKLKQNLRGSILLQARHQQIDYAVPVSGHAPEQQHGLGPHAATGVEGHEDFEELQVLLDCQVEEREAAEALGGRGLGDGLVPNHEPPAGGEAGAGSVWFADPGS